MTTQANEPENVSTRRKLGFFALGSLECELGLPQRAASEWNHPSFLYRWYLLGWKQREKEVRDGLVG